MEKQRLDKFLSNQLSLSRSKARDIIRKTGLYVDGRSVFDPSYIISPETAEIIYKGEKISYKKYIYILMNKPAGVLCASRDKNAKTVIDLIPEALRRRNLASVGRLDKNTTGLLLITDDGEFAHNCISPSKNVSKVYLAELDGSLQPSMVNTFKNGITLADGTTLKPAELQIIGENTAKITVCEGKYHQIKRMFGTVGLGVNSLKRLGIGALTIPEGLNEGECLEIAQNDALKALKA